MIFNALRTIKSWVRRTPALLFSTDPQRNLWAVLPEESYGIRDCPEVFELRNRRRGRGYHYNKHEIP